jgi:hypothetical protein
LYQEKLFIILSQPPFDPYLNPFWNFSRSCSTKRKIPPTPSLSYLSPTGPATLAGPPRPLSSFLWPISYARPSRRHGLLGPLAAWPPGTLLAWRRSQESLSLGGEARLRHFGRLCPRSARGCSPRVLGTPPKDRHRSQKSRGPAEP